MIGYDFSGVPLSIEGLDDEAAARLAARWTGYEGGDPAWLEVRARREPGHPGAWDPKGMTSRRDGDGIVFTMSGGSARVPRRGRVDVVLFWEDAEHRALALVNLVLAALACRLPERGGLLVHAAGIVIDGRAFVLVGAEGSGKTTWAGLSGASGARVIGDDLLIVEEGHLLATPLRAELATEATKGRFPLAGILVPAHAPSPSLEPLPRLAAAAALAANLPYVSDLPVAAIEAGALVSFLVDRVPCFRLGFSRTDAGEGLLRAV